MAVTLADVPTPNAKTWEGVFEPFHSKVKDVTFDASYPTGGESIAATALGWKVFVGALMLIPARNAAGSASYLVIPVPSTDQKTITLQLAQTAAAVTNPFAEVANASDQHLYTARVMFLGY